MLERDYLMRIIVQFAEVLRRSWFQARKEHDPKAAADLLESAVGDATEIDGATLLSLSPESIASVLQVSGTDPRVIEYVARGLMLSSSYLHEAGEGALANLRLEQARALSQAYQLDLPDTPEEMMSLLDDDEIEKGAESAIIDIEGGESKEEALWSDIKHQ